MPSRNVDESVIVAEFLHHYFGDRFAPIGLSEEEVAINRQVVEYVGDRFGRMKYILGLALDFTLLAQQLSGIDTDAKQLRAGLTVDQLFDRYPRVEQRGATRANTLTLQYGSATLGIRSIEEAVVAFFHRLNRSRYPSAYVYNTGMWRHYQDLLSLCFQPSESGRFRLCQDLIDFGLRELLVNPLSAQDTDRVRLYPEIIAGYPRTARDENAGLTFQALAYGFIHADRPHLSLVVDKVRTGSARQRRFGDIDCYFGLDLELSVEVKDLHISPTNRDRQLGDFVSKASQVAALGIAFVRSIEEATRVELADAGIHSLTQDDLLRIIDTWDWQKQDMAVHGMLHFLAHVEQNAIAVNRLLAFIASKDESHDSLAHYTPAANTQQPFSPT